MEKINGIAIDGGGIRGLIVTKQLVALEKELGGPIINHFKYLGLNSTSGIIGILLALGYSAQDVELFYKEHGPKIFKKKGFTWGIFKPRYNTEYLDTILDKLVGDKKLSDLKNNVVVSATNYTERYTEKLVFLFKSEKAREDKSRDFFLKDVIKATTAAPTYFKPVMVTSVDGNTQLLLGDGGLCINNPAHIMFTEMCKSYPNAEKHVLSYSTGKKIPNFKTQQDNLKAIESKGALGIVDDVVDIQLDANQYVADYNMKIAVEEKRCANYLRLKSLVRDSDGSVDNASDKNMKNMEQDGERSVLLNKFLLKSFLVNII